MVWSFSSNLAVPTGQNDGSSCQKFDDRSAANAPNTYNLTKLECSVAYKGLLIRLLLTLY
jgi:hypothetical protein